MMVFGVHFVLRSNSFFFFYFEPIFIIFCNSYSIEFLKWLRHLVQLFRLCVRRFYFISIQLLLEPERLKFEMMTWEKKCASKAENEWFQITFDFFFLFFFSSLNWTRFGLIHFFFFFFCRRFQITLVMKWNMKLLFKLIQLSSADEFIVRAILCWPGNKHQTNFQILWKLKMNYGNASHSTIKRRHQL